MKSKTVNNKILYAILFAFYFVLSCMIKSREDDFVFAAGIEKFGSIWEWVRWFSHNWGGRIIPQGILVLVLQCPPILFSFLNACAWILLLIYVKKVFVKTNAFSDYALYILFSSLFFLLITETVMKEAAFWKCANVLYLWGSATLLIAIFPIVAVLNNSIPLRRDYIVALPAIIYTASFEQAGLLMCGVAVILTFYMLLHRRCSMNKKIILLTLLTLFATAFFCTLPGNSFRYKIEILDHMQGYDMYSLVDKALWGIWNVIHNIENNAKYLILLIAATAVILLRRNVKGKRWFLVGAYLMLGYYLLCVIERIGFYCTGIESFLTPFFRFLIVDNVEFGFSGSLIVLSIIHFMVYVYLGSIILIIPTADYDVIGASFYFGGLATMWIMGFSPTIYVSGFRTQFLCYLFLICVEVRLLSCFPIKPNVR